MKQKITFFFALLLSCATFASAQTNVALSKSVFISSGNGASSVVDGTITGPNRWESAQGDFTQWLYVDLGAIHNISRVNIYWEAAGGKDFKVEVSNDASSWTAIQTITGNTISNNDYTGLTASGRYVRIYCTLRQLPYGYSIYELEVYGVNPGNNVAPSVSITSPGNNTSLTSPATFNIAATATDTDGTVTKVEFYNGATKLGEDLTAPYTYTWTGVTNGSYIVTAKAIDDDGDFTISSPITLVSSIPVITPSCGGLGKDSDYTYKFSWDNNNPTITFIPNPNRPTVGSSTLLFYYGTDPGAAMGANTITPNTPYQLTAAQGTLIYFYFTYSMPTGGNKDNSATKHSFTVGSCATANLALGKTSTASTDVKGAASLAFDGNAGTRWESDFSDPQWIYVDLQESYDITNVNITWQNAKAADYLIQVSNDASSWTTVKTVTGNTAVQNDWAVTGTGRYVRMYGTVRSGIYGYSIFEMVIMGTPAAVVLPVSLISFDTKLQTNGQVALNWSTSSELNNSHFIVEKSTDGITFTTVAQFASKNSNSNTRLNYTYVDATPSNGTNYYRLTQVDLNGTSKVLGVKSQQVNIKTANSVLYPNPLQGNKFNLSLANQQDGQVAVSITSLLGKSVYQGNVNVVSGTATVSISTQLVSGLYLVNVEGQTLRLIVE